MKNCIKEGVSKIKHCFNVNASSWFVTKKYVADVNESSDENIYYRERTGSLKLEIKNSKNLFKCNPVKFLFLKEVLSRFCESSQQTHL